VSWILECENVFRYDRRVFDGTSARQRLGFRTGRRNRSQHGCRVAG